MNASPLYLGTSSWTVVGWEIAFYPPRQRRLTTSPTTPPGITQLKLTAHFIGLQPSRLCSSGGNERRKDLSLPPSSPRSLPTRRSLVDAESDLKSFLGVMETCWGRSSDLCSFNCHTLKRRNSAGWISLPPGP